jgi:hypothetical protein
MTASPKARTRKLLRSHAGDWLHGCHSSRKKTARHRPTERRSSPFPRARCQVAYQGVKVVKVIFDQTSLAVPRASCILWMKRRGTLGRPRYAARRINTVRDRSEDYRLIACYRSRRTNASGRISRALLVARAICSADSSGASFDFSICGLLVSLPSRVASAISANA